MFAAEGAAASIVIAIGSNQRFGGLLPADLCRAAFACVARLPDFRGEGVEARLSRLYGTRPIPDEGQPEFVNAVGSLRLSPERVATIEPAVLLSRLLAIESQFGRVRTEANGCRTLDLDLITVGTQMRSAPDPLLPHPRCGVRRFVLEPLAELVPGWRHPRSGETVEALLAGLPDQGVRRLA